MFGPSPVLSPLTSQISAPPLEQPRGPSTGSERRSRRWKGRGRKWAWCCPLEERWRKVTGSGTLPQLQLPHILRKVYMGEEVVANTPPPNPPRLTRSLFTCSPILRLPKWTWGLGQCSNPTRPGGAHLYNYRPPAASKRIVQTRPLPEAHRRGPGCSRVWHSGLPSLHS